MANMAPRVSRTHHRLHLSSFHELEAYPHGSVLLLQAASGGGPHGYGFGGMHDLDGRMVRRVGRKLSFHRILLTHEDHLDIELICGKDRALNHRTGGTVAAHCINGNPYHR